MLSITPGPALHEPGRQHPHEAGEADEIDGPLGERGVERLLEPLAGGKGLVVDDDGVESRRARPLEAGGVGAVRDHEGDGGGIVGCVRGLDQGDHIGPAAGDQHADATTGHPRSSRPVVRTRSPSDAAITSPMRSGVSPSSRSRAITASA